MHNLLLILFVLIGLVHAQLDFTYTPSMLKYNEGGQAAFHHVNQSKIYVFGGGWTVGSSYGVHADIQVANVSQNMLPDGTYAITRLSSPFTTIGSLPVAVSGHAFHVLTVNGTDFAYIFSGCNSQKIMRCPLDNLTSGWTIVDAYTFPFQIGFATTFKTDQAIYIVGGMDEPSVQSTQLDNAAKQFSILIFHLHDVPGVR